ncbi:unnamed protein product [Miscanthus lutarioriparius]|uniref:Tetrahydrofolate dehydrogenase/cyclohydrolase NAD(P)-binding domain-containing protein n=1 Tax=Miscanthus lutarioriparius TaxID=422564 RepID=A0A811RXB2_9POAL|nr:unnamed protein product [Miscanthus lutarioriparius]
MELLSRGGVSVRGKLAAVVGRSNIVGLPVSLLLLKVRQADIVIAAAGRPMMIKGDWIKPGAAVIDVGHIVSAAAEQDVMINGNGDLIKPGAVVIHDADTDSVDDDPAELVGDVDFAEVSKVAGFLTPVPGGAGPMMVAMLLKNTVDATKQGQGICKDAK